MECIALTIILGGILFFSFTPKVASTVTTQIIVSMYEQHLLLPLVLNAYGERHVGSSELCINNNVTIAIKEYHIMVLLHPDVYTLSLVLVQHVCFASNLDSQILNILCNRNMSM